MTIDNLNVVKSFYNEVENKKDPNAASKFWIDDLKWHGCVNSPIFPGYFEGIDNLKHALDIYFEAVDPDAQVVQSIVSGDDRVAVRLRVTAKHTGNLLGCPATGKDAVFTAAGSFVIKNGKIIEEWIIADFLGMALQFGFELRLPGGQPAKLNQELI